MGEKEIRDKLNTYIEKVREHFQLKMVVLYGSFATGEATENSDIDIAVFIDKDTHSRNHLDDSAILNKLICGIDSRIEPVLYYSKELETVEQASLNIKMLNYCFSGDPYFLLRK
jgi:predicted nucleotidyltransferase